MYRAKAISRTLANHRWRLAQVASAALRIIVREGPGAVSLRTTDDHGQPA